jgi:hypothetical protein
VSLARHHLSSRFSELVGMPPSTDRRHAARDGDAVVGGETGDQTDQESRSAGHRAAASLTPKLSQTYCSKLVRSSQATPTETAKAAPA